MVHIGKTWIARSPYKLGIKKCAANEKAVFPCQGQRY